jgi:hypothetical protein
MRTSNTPPVIVIALTGVSNRSLTSSKTSGASEPVPTHREGISRRRKNARVGGADQREQRRENHGNDADCGERVFRRNLHRRLRVGQRSLLCNTDHHGHDGHVDPGGDDERSEDPKREIPVRIFDFLGDAGDLRDASIRDKHEPGRTEDSLDSAVEEALESGALDAWRARDDEPNHHGQHDSNDGDLHPARLLRADDVQDDQQDSNRESDRRHRQIEQQHQVRRPADECQGPFERQREPRSNAGNGSEQWTHRPFDVQVGSTRFGHRSRHLGLAQCRGQHQHAREKVREHDRRTGHLHRQSRQNEDTAANHCTNADGRHRGKSQIAFELLRHYLEKETTLGSYSVDPAARSISSLTDQVFTCVQDVGSTQHK